GRRVVAAPGLPRAGRCALSSALQRGEPRPGPAADRGEAGRDGRPGPDAGSVAGRLAGARGPAADGADPSASGPHRAPVLRPARARLLLRGVSLRAGARGGPVVPAGPPRPA